MKWGEEVRAKLIEGYRLGMTQKLACQYAGISVRAFHVWKGKAAAGRPDYLQFFQELKRAEATHAGEALEVIKKAARDGSWQAAAWLLERRHGYRREESIEIAESAPDRMADPSTPEGKAAIVAQVAELPIELLKEALAVAEEE